ncbi:hypothetical protein SDC9_49107 [bioreactor metagenome]|uniref:Uncharacterized protein n=1 Tax=bioreactor metagenome TaxID=1076179 RepID=A0A644WGF8_9ZZZZ
MLFKAYRLSDQDCGSLPPRTVPCVDRASAEPVVDVQEIEGDFEEAVFLLSFIQIGRIEVFKYIHHLTDS